MHNWQREIEAGTNWGAAIIVAVLIGAVIGHALGWW